MAERRAPMPHQVNFLAWAKRRSGVGAFLEMRLGKSLCALRWGRTRPDVERALIVAPLSVTDAWSRELTLERMDHVMVYGTAAQKQRALEEAAALGVVWHVTNKEALVSPGRSGRRGGPSPLALLPWDLVIIDESPCIRNPKSITSRVATTKLVKATYRAALSGLPNPEGPEDYVQQMLFVCGGEFMGHSNFWTWRQEHMIPQHFGGWTVRASSIGKLKAAVEAASFRLTRRQAGMTEPKVREQRRVHLPAKVMRAIRSAREEFVVSDRMTMNALAANTMEAQLAGGRYPHDHSLYHDAKLEELRSLVSGELKREQVVVWARYTEELRAIAETLRAIDVSTRLVTGHHSREERAEAVTAFQRGKAKYLVAQPKCLSMGVDLSVASTAVVYSNYYDYEIRTQLEDRIVHPKKREPVLIVDLVASGTLDEDVADAIADKRATAVAFNTRFKRGFLHKYKEATK